MLANSGLTLNKEITKQPSLNESRKDKKEKSKAFSRDMPISDQMWKARFEQLLKLDLIELGDDYYEDKLFFNNPAVLDQKFTILEEENLFFIHRLQEVEQYLEITGETEERVHKKLEKEFNAQDVNRTVLQGKIRDANDNLEALKKTRFGSNIVEQNPVLAPVTKKKEVIPVDFDSLLKEIHTKIGEIVLTKVDSSTEVTGKEPIQLLYVSKAV